MGAGERRQQCGCSGRTVRRALWTSVLRLFIIALYFRGSQMPLPFSPNPGTVLMCDFNTGFKPPEMVKMRPVVTVSPRRRDRTELVTVVPLSTTPPVPPEPYHHRLRSTRLPGKLDKQETWAKCDLIYTVAFWRLDRIRTGRSKGKRQYRMGTLSDEDWSQIRQCVKIALGLDMDAI